MNITPFCMNMLLMIALVSIVGVFVLGRTEQYVDNGNCLIFSCSDRNEISSITRPVLEHYCAIHGYRLELFDSNPEPSRHISWGKLKILKELIDTHGAEYSYYIWVDDDILITEPSIPITNFIEEYGFDTSHHTLMISDDVTCSKDSFDKCVNAGIFIAKPSIREFLDYWWSIPENVEEYAASIHDTPWEQMCLDYILNMTDKGDDVLIVPHRTIQSILGNNQLGKSWHPGDFAVHTAGMGQKECALTTMKLAIK